MLAHRWIGDAMKSIAAGVKRDNIVTVTLKPLATRQKHAVVSYDSLGKP